jgi:predicted dehydrogenase
MKKKKVKVGVAGCGVVATAYYLPCLAGMENVELTAVCDIHEARTSACVRLFGARESYQDYHEMIRRADIEAVFVLTGPGTHVPFTLEAVERGKHVLLQKPMATDMVGARAIAEAVRRRGVKALVEPSSNSPLDPLYPALRRIVRDGALGAPYWFLLAEARITEPGHPGLAGNPYGAGAFYTRDSGGMLFDYPYGPSQIVSVLGSCRSVSSLARVSVPDRTIVPDARYDEFLASITDPAKANYWPVVLGLPRTQAVRMEAPDNVFSLYQMADGTTGVFHVGRLFLPTLPGAGCGGLQVYGTEGNLVFGGGYAASVISTRPGVLPSLAPDGWYHVPLRGDQARAVWPQPTPGDFNYYHESTRHLVACILEDRDPVVNVEWGLHITEMMYGALEASRTGCRYDMTTAVDW